MSAPVGNALIGQSGGPTAVINQSLVGVIEECLRSDRVKGVYGALHGVKGVLNEDMIDLGKESAAVLEGVANTPCAALRSVRMKPTEEDCARMLEVFEANDIRYFFYIGGNDSAETAHILNEIAVELARVAVWIHTFVPGLPMSSLDHTLVCSSTLFGKTRTDS